MKKNFLINISLPAIAIAFLLFMFISISGKKTPEPRTPTIDPPTSTFKHKIAGLGIVESDTRMISMGSHTEGVVSKIYVSEGQQIDKNSPLFSIEDSEFKAKVEHARAKLKVAEIHYEDVSHHLNLFESIKDKRAISYEELSRKRFAAKKAHAEMIEAKTNLKLAEAKFNNLTVKSPVDAHILKVNIKAGEYLGNNGEQPVIIGNLHKMHVRVEIDETDINRINQDARAVGILRSNSKSKIPLKFIKYDPYFMPKSNLNNDITEKIDTRVIELLYEFNNDKIGAFPGQRMDVFIEEEK
ncbi:MAG: efflux RND transporter periplasmic adaptor subunit [Alphaproteobacteria bacterium]|nr:efflux RND transporter periplasmic adaptor subunit [Alphaproteobacteria bacterium]